MSVLEGLCAGLPVIASNVGSIPEMIVPGKNGFLANPKDANSFYEALRNMNDCYTDLCQRIDEEQSDFIKRYGYDSCKSKLLEIYSRFA